MRAAIYTRSSVGDETSTERQERACRSFAQMKGWTVAEVFTDGVTGSGKKDRPGWRALSRAVSASEVEAVIVFAISRAARNVRALLEFAELCEERGVVFESTSEPIGGEYGKVFLSILGALAELEVKAKSDRMKLKQAELKSRGLFQGGFRPFGYQLVRNGDGNGTTLEPDPGEALLIVDAARRLLNGSSLRSIVADWDARGIVTTPGNPWTRSHLRALMTRPLPGILEAADHRRLVRLFASRGRGEIRSRYLLTGLLRCGVCGAEMVGRPNRGIPQYACVATGVVHLTVRARPLEEEVAERASGRRRELTVPLTDPSEPLLSERAGLEDRMAELGSAWAGGDAFAMSAAKELRVRIDEIDEALASIEPDEQAFWPDTLAEYFSFVEPLELEYWERLRDDPQLREWLEGLIEHVTLKPAPRAGKFDPGRVVVKWRTGVVQKA